jgi:drug/metabolite transporter (DMT)-like permease
VRDPNASTVRGTLLILLSACCFGSVVVLTALAERAGATLATVIFWRYLIGGAVLVAVAGGPRRAWAGGREGWRLLALGGGGQTVVAVVSLKALDYIPAATLAFLFYTYPAWVAVFAAMRGSERIDPTRAAALVLSLAGIATMVGAPWLSTGGASGALHPVGVALALASAVAYALYIPLINRLAGGHAPPAVSAHIALGVAALVGAGGLALGQLSAVLAPAAWAAVGTLAVVSTAVAFVVFLRGLRALGAVRTAIVSTVEPFWTTLLAAATLGQPLRASTVAGGALIACAVLLLQRRPRPSVAAAA